MAKTATDRNSAIDYINRDIVNVKNELHTLNKLVRDGNGQPSLLQQVTSLNSKVEGIESTLTQELCNLHAKVAACNALHGNKEDMPWQYRSAIIVALITSLTSIIIHFANK
jgi:hypothetical protein